MFEEDKLRTVCGVGVRGWADGRIEGVGLGLKMHCELTNASNTDSYIIQSLNVWLVLNFSIF